MSYTLNPKLKTLDATSLIFPPSFTGVSIISLKTVLYGPQLQNLKKGIS